FYGTFAPVVLSCFRGQQVPCPGLQFVQAVVDFDYPVAFGLMALSPHGAAFAAPGLIIAHTGNLSIGAHPLTLTGKGHLLTHGSFIEVFLLILIQALQEVGAGLLCALRLFMEVIVLDITLYFL